MRQRDLLVKMDVTELKEWMAFDLANDTEFKSKARREIALEEQASQTAEQEAQKVRELFMGFGLTLPA